MADNKIEGEGSYTAAREYDDKATAFAEDEAKVKAAAEKAKKAVESSEAAELEKAEAIGKAKARK